MDGDEIAIAALDQESLLDDAIALAEDNAEEMQHLQEESPAVSQEVDDEEDFDFFALKGDLQELKQ